MDTSLFTRDGKYLMLALDHDNSFRKNINPERPDAVSRDDIVSLKSDIIESCASHMSGVLIDSDFGLPAYEYLRTHHITLPPFLLRVEKSGYTGEEENRMNEIMYGSEALHSSGASGVKLLLYMNPSVPVHEHQMRIAESVIEDAHHHHLPVFLEFVTYDVSSHKASRLELIQESLTLFIGAGLVPDVWKLEYPGDAEGCQKITAQVGNTPWILLSRGVSFEEFVPQLKNAKEAGAKGFLAGRALWQDVGTLHNDIERAEFFSETLPKRFEILNDVCMGTTHGSK